MVQRIAVGWDLHRKFSQVSLWKMDEDEIQVVRRQRLEHADRAVMAAWMAQLPRSTPVAMEGAFGWQWVADLLAEMGLDPHLGHPPALRVQARHEPKSDRVDADRLARYWLQKKFPECYLASPEVRQIRERVRYRMALSGVRMGLKNRIQALLHRQGILHEFSDLFGKQGRAFLKQLTLPPASRAVLDGWLALLDGWLALLDGWLALLDDVLTRLAEVEDWMRQNLVEDEIVARLQTIPGIGLILAHVIRAEVGELERRFYNRRKFSSYCGLAPLADDSADRHGARHISPACNHALRWAFIEAAAACLHARACPRKLRRLHQRLTHGGRCRQQQARVAVARELSELVYIIWKTGEPYREPSSP